MTKETFEILSALNCYEVSFDYFLFLENPNTGLFAEGLDEELKGYFFVLWINEWTQSLDANEMWMQNPDYTFVDRFGNITKLFKLD